MITANYYQYSQLPPCAHVVFAKNALLRTGRRLTENSFYYYELSLLQILNKPGLWKVSVEGRVDFKNNRAIIQNNTQHAIRERIIFFGRLCGLHFPKDLVYAFGVAQPGVSNFFSYCLLSCCTTNFMYEAPNIFLYAAIRSRTTLNY